jgi:ferredoxin, 2Fe-2S
MPKVTFLPQNKIIEYVSDHLPYGRHGEPGSLLDIALNFEIPLEHVCGGNSACDTCQVIVREGDQNLSPQNEFEEDRLRYLPDLTSQSRLGCQAVVNGDVIVEIPERKQR